MPLSNLQVSWLAPDDDDLTTNLTFHSKARKGILFFSSSDRLLPTPHHVLLLPVPRPLRTTGALAWERSMNETFSSTLPPPLFRQQLKFTVIYFQRHRNSSEIDFCGLGFLLLPRRVPPPSGV